MPDGSLLCAHPKLSSLGKQRVPDLSDRDVLCDGSNFRVLGSLAQFSLCVCPPFVIGYFWFYHSTGNTLELHLIYLPQGMQSQRTIVDPPQHTHRHTHDIGSSLPAQPLCLSHEEAKSQGGKKTICPRLSQTARECSQCFLNKDG
jgi:hypothetical protein